VSRTDKDRPYLVKQHDPLARGYRRVSHYCSSSGRRFLNPSWGDCDYKQYTLKEELSWSRSRNWKTHMNPVHHGCCDLLWEDQNRPTERQDKRYLKRLARRKVGEKCRMARREEDLDMWVKFQVQPYGKYSHKYW
jgi:hypothetical protein